MAGDADETLDFYAATQEGELLEVTMTGGTGDADLFIDNIEGGYEDCASEMEGNGENCSVEGRAEWGIRVVGIEAYEGVRIQAEQLSALSEAVLAQDVAGWGVRFEHGTVARRVVRSVGGEVVVVLEEA